jgi:hypothetical protein
MVSETKTANEQLDLLMEALKHSIRKALDEDLLIDEAAGLVPDRGPEREEKDSPD